MKTLRSAVLFLSLCAAAACTPMNLPDSCRIDTDCNKGLVCDHELCVVPTRDAGSSHVDAGVVEASDAGFLTEQDAGVTPVDAGASCVPSVELCNGVDDDCDGQVDELAVLTNTDGGVVAVDGGTGASDGTCVVGIGACQRSGQTSCAGGQLVCSVTGGAAVVELCNGMDDDCDGQIDEPGAELCPAAGQTCGAGACSCPSGQAVCGSACVTLGSTCSVGVGACARTGSNLCTSNAVTCSASPGAPGNEVCNSIDDDCDGQVDEVGAGLCPAQGQLCAAGACACPQGQAVCNGVCKVLTAEVCDGLDNDCDGQTDEGVTITCLTDADNDRYASSTTTSEVCADASRPQAGTCPSGYVSQATSLGLDCAATDATKFQNLNVRTDGDADGFCLNPTRTECAGAMPAAGTRLAAACHAMEDCNDADAAKFQNLVVRNDVDGDGYCGSAAAFSECSGSVPSAGRKLSSTCPSNADCDDASTARFQLLSVMADADNDNVCAGAAMQQCTGASPQAGFKLAAACSGGLDCNDANGNEWQYLSVRADADADGWCAQATVQQCTNSAPKPGFKLASQCGATPDCSDANPRATSQCFPQVVSAQRIKACGAFIPATQDITFDWDCGLGFHRVNRAIQFVSGDNVSTESFVAPLVAGFQSGIDAVRATCNAGAVGQKTLAVVTYCQAD